MCVWVCITLQLLQLVMDASTFEIEDYCKTFPCIWTVTQLASNKCQQSIIGIFTVSIYKTEMHFYSLELDKLTYLHIPLAYVMVCQVSAAAYLL